MSTLQTVISSNSAQLSNYLEQLQVIGNLNPRLAKDGDSLLKYYQEIKSTWTPGAIDALKSETGLSLKSRFNRCQFAHFAALSEIERIKQQFDYVSIPPSAKNSEGTTTENTKVIDFIALRAEKELKVALSRIAALEVQVMEQQAELEKDALVLSQKEAELSSVKDLNLLILMLPPGPPLNGTELCPSLKVLGSPTTKTQLKHNYRQLIAREHPDISIHPPDVAVKRYIYVQQLYYYYERNWDKLKPTRKISQKHYQLLMNATTDFPTESFWPDRAD